MRHPGDVSTQRFSLLQPQGSVVKGESVMNLKTMKNLDKTDLLYALGLESKSSTVGRIAEALGTFGVGLLVGAGLGLILAPKSGRALRTDIHERLQSAAEGVGDRLDRLTGCDARASVQPGNAKPA
jgi:hypothetical protein